MAPPAANRSLDLCYGWCAEACGHCRVQHGRLRVQCPPAAACFAILPLIRGSGCCFKGAKFCFKPTAEPLLKFPTAWNTCPILASSSPSSHDTSFQQCRRMALRRPPHLPSQYPMQPLYKLRKLKLVQAPHSIQPKAPEPGQTFLSGTQRPSPHPLSFLQSLPWQRRKLYLGKWER